MKGGNYSMIALFVCLALFGIAEVCNADNKLRLNYYRGSCRQAESTVREIIQDKVRNNPALGAKLIRMHFHDCFVRGCDGSVLLDTVDNSSKAEKDAFPNLSLSGFDVIDDIKAAIEKICFRKVSCADILALAARDAVSAWFAIENRKPFRPLWEVPLGRKDGRISLANETNGNIPSPFANFTSLLQLFVKKGLDVNDLVLLSGAHTIGVSHCGAFSRRLYNFTGKGDADPSLNGTYADELRQKCPNPASPSITVGMDPNSSLSFDKHYYDILLENKGLFISDAALLTNPKSKSLVTTLQRSRSLFFPSFARSMVRMGAIQDTSGGPGEVREKCRVVNPIPN